MSNTNFKQVVKLFSDEEITGIQEVYIEKENGEQPWIVIEHSGNELSLSLDNWESLNQLVMNAKKALKIK